MTDDVKRDVSEFNSAVSYLNRLNVLYSHADEAAINLNVYTWFHTLLAIFRELSTEMKQDEINNQHDIINDLREMVNTQIQRVQLDGYNTVTPELYDKLHNFEMFLRKVMKESGLQQRILDEAAKALR